MFSKLEVYYLLAGNSCTACEKKQSWTKSCCNTAKNPNKTKKWTEIPQKSQKNNKHVAKTELSSSPQGTKMRYFKMPTTTCTNSPTKQA